MSSPQTIRLITDPAANSGGWNMALDEALLESAVHRGDCTVRIYRWKEPTVSLGYFQREGEIDPESPWANLPWVKRLSGGGAILHHHEWTYCCAVPAGHPAIREPYRLYEAVHRKIIELLQTFGIEATLRGEVDQPQADQPGQSRPFLCFSRGDSRDILLDGHKIVGSAQRRRKGAVLQHGSILLRASEFAPEFPGIVDLAAGCPVDESLGATLGMSIAAGISGNVTRSKPTDAELNAAKRSARNRL